MSHDNDAEGRTNMKMKVNELVGRLHRIRKDEEGGKWNRADAHSCADAALLAYIDDEDVYAAFNAIGKCYFEPGGLAALGLSKDNESNKI